MLKSRKLTSTSRKFQRKSFKVAGNSMSDYVRHVSTSTYLTGRKLPFGFSKLFAPFKVPKFFLNYIHTLFQHHFSYYF